MRTTGERPFHVLGVQQIALGATSKSELRALWVDRLGLALTGWFRSERENVDEDVCVAGVGLGRVEVDLMEPIDATAKPAVHLPALNHVGLWIDDLRGAVAWLEANGVRMAPGGIRAGASGHDICFIHPRPNEAFPVAGAGVLIELVQAPADVVAAWRAASDDENASRAY